MWLVGGGGGGIGGIVLPVVGVGDGRVGGELRVAVAVVAVCGVIVWGMARVIGDTREFVIWRGGGVWRRMCLSGRRGGD